MTVADGAAERIAESMRRYEAARKAGEAAFAKRWGNLTREDAHQWALRYVREGLESYPGERLIAWEGCWGSDADGPGFDVGGGWIVIAGIFPEGVLRIRSVRDLRGHAFRLSDLVAEARAGQLSLFGGRHG